MSVLNQVVTDKYAIYNADCVEFAKTLPDGGIHRVFPNTRLDIFFDDIDEVSVAALMPADAQDARIWR